MIPFWHSKHFLPYFAIVALALLSTGFSVFVILSSTGSTAHAGVLDSVSEEVQKVFDQSSDAIVKVRTLGANTPRAGTGFFIDNQGTILTSYAVVKDADRAWVEFGEKKVMAEIKAQDLRTNLAMLKIDAGKTPYLKFGDSDKLRTASGLISVAYPFNLPLSPDFGLVNGFDVRYRNLFFPTTHIRASLPVSPGQIGGPVLNSKSEVVGVLVLSIEDGKACYAIPTNSVKKIINDFKEFGEARHGWAGVGVVEGYADDTGKKPVIISVLYEGTPAETSGLKQGDRLLKVGEREIQHPTDLMDVSFFSTIGEDMEVTVSRNGETVTCQLSTTTRPDGSTTIRNRVVPPPSAIEDSPNLALPVSSEQPVTP